MTLACVPRPTQVVLIAAAYHARMPLFRKRDSTKAIDAHAVAIETFPSPAFQKLREHNPDVPPLAGWTITRIAREPEVPAAGGRVEVWGKLKDPTDRHKRGAAALRADGSFSFVILELSQPTPTHLLGIYTDDGQSSWSPGPAAGSEAEWGAAIIPAIAYMLSRAAALASGSAVDSAGRVRPESHPAFRAFCRLGGAFPHLRSWRPTAVTDQGDRYEGGRVELWLGAVADGPISYPHLLVGYLSDESIPRSCLRKQWAQSTPSASWASSTEPSTTTSAPIRGGSTSMSSFRTRCRCWRLFCTTSPRPRPERRSAILGPRCLLKGSIAVRGHRSRSASGAP